MIDIFGLYRSLQADVNTQQGGHVRPESNFILWVREISLEIFREKFDNWEKSQKVTDEFSAPFLKSVNVIVTPAPGQPYDLVRLPPEYGYFSSARVILNASQTGCPCSGLDIVDGEGNCRAWVDEDEKAYAERMQGSDFSEKAIHKVDNQRWAAALDHKIIKPSLARPIMTQFDGGLKVAPKGIGVIVLDYLKKPVEPVFAYTIGPDGQIIYNPSASTSLDWSNLVIGEFIARLGKRYAKFVREAGLYQISEDERQLSGS